MAQMPAAGRPPNADRPPDGESASRARTTRLTLNEAFSRIGEGKLVLALLAAVLVSHSLNMFKYPLYLGDEGIYLEQAWAVLREGRLSPYTYFYDHAPGGWLLLAWWVLLLPGKFLTFGMAVNSGRVLMLIINLISAFLLYRITKLLSRSDTAAIVTTIFYQFSPLPLYYERMILLDNFMVFWLLVAMYFILADSDRVLTLVGSGAAFGIAVLTKENAIFFAPVLVYILYTSVRQTHRVRFALAGWGATTLMIVSFYPLFALLKNELIPSLSTLFTNAPAEHVSLLSTLIWQMGRAGGSIFDPFSDFWTFFWAKWWFKDPVILVLGAAAMVANLIIGWRSGRKGYLVAGLMALSFVFYLARGSVILEFYVVPVLPFLALNVGLLTDGALRRLPLAAALFAFVGAMAVVLVFFVVRSYDHYTLDLTQLQIQQVNYIRNNIPANAVMLIDDDLWVDLHEPARGHPVYTNAQSHWKAAQDPDIRDRLLHGDWRNVDYLVMSNKLDEEYARSYTKDSLPMQALQHSTLIWSLRKGDVRLEIRKVDK
jgi:4-amino-4-deoxy-L-arabinose transferase-like glycosyltransferase